MAKKDLKVGDLVDIKVKPGSKSMTLNGREMAGTYVKESPTEILSITHHNIGTQMAHYPFADFVITKHE